ncbi:MAG TPA: hypothetical protein VFS66_15025 [Acidimicrobiia bacterium]|nr:hypothetical protein [Acidimicrobiia bacterium]
MVEIPEDLLRRSAEAKAKALGVPVEQVLAEMKGEGPPVELPQNAAEPETAEEATAEGPGDAADAVEEVPDEDAPDETPEIEADTSQDVAPEEPKTAETAQPEESPAAMVASSPESPVEMIAETGAVAVAEATEEEVETEDEPIPAVDVEDTVQPESNGSSNGSGNGKVASVVSPRPSVPPAGLPEGVRTQRLLTVVKARAIQNVKAEPTDKVNTWPHLMLMEFGALLAITGLLIIMAVIIHSPLLEPANFNATPNPSKAPWYFLGLQELLSYFDPQIAGVTVPTIVGLIGFMAVPYVDKNPSTRPSDRKFAILLYSIFLAGAATLTIIGVLFRGQGFNWSYPWVDGVYFDDLKDWVHFE